MWKCMPNEVDGADKVELHRITPCAGIEVIDEPGRRSTRVCHENVEPAETLSGFSDRPLYICLTRNITREGKHLRFVMDFGKPGGSGRNTLVTSRAHRHTASLRQQSGGNRETEPRARSSHRCSRIIQAELHSRR